ncbi:MAG: acyl-[acyl-carrier-protein] thioesterase [Flammeovirgaceae bacterium]
MMTKHLTCTLPIKFYHLDAQNRVSLPALINLLFEASGKHAELNGFGVEKTRELGFSWIVGRIGLDCRQMLSQISQVHIETWIDRTIGPSTLRKFRIKDDKGNLLATSCFTYAGLNLTTRQPINVSEIIGDEIPDLEYGKGIRMPAKVRPAKTEMQEHASFQVQYGDLDYNQHATTTKYVQWIMNAFPLELHEGHYVQSLDINFSNELLYGDGVNSLIAQNAEKDYTIELQTKGDVACRARVTWFKA